MNWDYRKFPRHPVATQKFETIVIDTILSYYHYRFDPELGKGFCAIHWIPCACTAYANKVDKYW